MLETKITINDAWQKGYTYTRTEPVGQNYDSVFKPELTPQEMLALGVFGGRYFWDKPDEFSSVWYKDAKLSEDGENITEFNFFDIDASQPLKVWQEKGWIHPDDPRGWFQWYARYYMGRRHEDDARQIARWRAFRRHKVQVEKGCQKGDFFCRRKQRQALLHWAYDSRKL